MANPTSNFGWQMPTSTDLVTDLPADFEVFGQAVDTTLVDLKGGTTGQVLAKASNTDMDFVWSADAAGMTNPMTTTGDIIYSSSGSTPARLGIGSTGNVLTVASGVPSWSAPAAAGQNFTLLNSGGTALTGAQTVTVSGISGKNTLYIRIVDASTVNADVNLGLRFNSDTSSNYYMLGMLIAPGDTYNRAQFESQEATGSFYIFARNGEAATQAYSGIIVQGANSTGIKPITAIGGGSYNAGSSGEHYRLSNGHYAGSSAITSVSVHCSSGDLDGGTIYVYTSA